MLTLHDARMHATAAAVAGIDLSRRSGGEGG
jgi:hypothetical protein